MSTRRPASVKVETLRADGALHPHPDAVIDPLFLEHEFFDPRDLVQVRYEMLRRVETDGQSVSETALRFGVSRPTLYHARTAFTHEGLVGLLPRKRGPRGAHKLTETVIAFLRSQDPSLRSAELAQLVWERFGVHVHPRSVERALVSAGKKLQ